MRHAAMMYPHHGEYHISRDYTVTSDLICHRQFRISTLRYFTFLYNLFCIVYNIVSITVRAMKRLIFHGTNCTINHCIFQL